jgi:hypothetical protein
MPLDPTNQSVPVALPQWGAYRLAMLTNQAYQRVSGATSDQRAVSRIEAYFSTEVENWPIAKILWGQMMVGCPVAAKPSTAEAGGWTVLAEKTNMPFSFNDLGEFQIKP